MLKKAIAKYLIGDAEDILARLAAVRCVKISRTDGRAETDALKKLGIPDLPDENCLVFTEEYCIENLPHARHDITVLMRITDPYTDKTRSLVLTSAYAPNGYLIGYLADLPLKEADLLPFMPYGI